MVKKLLELDQPINKVVKLSGRDLKDVEEISKKVKKQNEKWHNFFIHKDSEFRVTN